MSRRAFPSSLSPLNLAADAAIGAYQRYVYPYKGFCCAYRAHTGKCSCSAYGRAIVQKLGLLALFTALPQQLERCTSAYQSYQASRQLRQSNAKNDSRKKKSQDCVDAGELSCDAAQMASDIPCDGLPCDCSI